MFITNHVLVGSLIGLALPRRPIVAFGAGVASHYVCDAVPHWGIYGDRPRFLKYAVTDGLIGLTTMTVIARKVPAPSRIAVLAGMLGAAFPDTDKPAELFFDRSPFPVWADAFHTRIQRESPRRLRHEIAFGLALAAGLALFSRSADRC